MNRVLIFAGGKGTRMKTNGNIPKQFLEIDGKSIIVHTLNIFETNEAVEDIVVVCIKDWIDVLKKQIIDNGIKKVSKVLAGGEIGFDSRMIGLEYLYSTRENEDDLVLIHDGVRPFVPQEVINRNIELAKETGNAITVAPATETIIFKGNREGDKILNRDDCVLARAPQTFKIGLIFSYYKKAKQEGQTEIVDSASLADFYGEKLHYVICPQENIKVTTPIDFFAAKGIMASLKNNS